MTPIWAWFGYDEPNYTYAPGGRQLLSELAALSPVPVYVRTHNLLTSGDGTASLKWGSTTAYREDASGRPIYDWTIVDRILSTYVERGMKPLVEIGFMPEALSSHPSPYRHAWKPGGQAELFTGWSYPPTDYDKWRQLVYEWVRHSVEKYGRAAVESWWWEVWNEPDIGYWHGTVEEYQKLYDYAADGLKRALPTARIGGPHVTGPNGPRPQQFLKAFLEHCLHGTNYATGKPGSPLDYVGFHAKGAPRVAPEGFVRMSVRNQLQAIDNACGIVGSFPELSRVPIVIGESDPEGCAACPMSTNPSNAYRNGTMYSSYTAEQLARTYELTDRHKVNLIGAVTWAFEFEEQPYFAGFRDLSTNGIDKPVLNVFRMLGRMKGDRVRAEGDNALTLDAILEHGVVDAPDVGALATADAHSVSVLIWNYHDDDRRASAADVTLTVSGVTAGSATLTHYRIDDDHSNAYAAWLKMGSPASLSESERARLAQIGGLDTLAAPGRVVLAGGTATIPLSLPRQGVSLVTLEW